MQAHDGPPEDYPELACEQEARQQEDERAFDQDQQGCSERAIAASLLAAR
jgi:hypothetical protein